MPRKIKLLVADLKREGFTMRPGKGSHRVFKKGGKRVVIAGKMGDDAKRYQEQEVAEAIKEAK